MDRAEITAELFDVIDNAKRSMHGHMQAVVEGHDISRTQLELLFTIRHHQPTTAKSLAQKLNLTPGAISQLIEDLFEQSLVDRETDPADRRRHVIRISAEGEAVIKALDKRRHDAINQVIKDLTDEELLMWLKIQKHIIKAYQELHQTKANETK